MQTHIRIQNPNEGDFWKVVSLCNHLRTHQNIRLLLSKGFENFIMSFLTARRVIVHTQNASVGIEFRKFRLNTLRARTCVGKFDAPTFGTSRKHIVLLSAIVAL